MQSLAHWLIWNGESYGDMHRAQRKGPLCLGACQILGSAQRTSRTLLSALTLVLEVEGEESSLLILPAPHPASLSLYSKHSRPSCTCFCGGKKLPNSTNQIWARFSWRRETNLTLHMRASGLTQCTFCAFHSACAIDIDVCQRKFTHWRTVTQRRRILSSLWVWDPTEETREEKGELLYQWNWLWSTQIYHFPVQQYYLTHTATKYKPLEISDNINLAIKLLWKLNAWPWRLHNSLAWPPHFGVCNLDSMTNKGRA